MKENTLLAIEHYMTSQAELKQHELRQLHEYMIQQFPEVRLWFLDGTNEDGKVVSNPNIGYGNYTITYANGSKRDFYKVGFSLNTSGISVYIMGLKDKKYLAETYGPALGKASITGYCIKFKSLKDINLNTLQAAIKDRMEVEDC